MAEAKKSQPAFDPKAWADITQKWAAAGGESLAALSASLRASSKANPLGQLKADDPVRKQG